MSIKLQNNGPIPVVIFNKLELIYFNEITASKFSGEITRAAGVKEERKKSFSRFAVPVKRSKKKALLTGFVFFCFFKSVTTCLVWMVSDLNGVLQHFSGFQKSTMIVD